MKLRSFLKVLSIAPLAFVRRAFSKTLLDHPDASVRSYAERVTAMPRVGDIVKWRDWAATEGRRAWVRLSLVTHVWTNGTVLGTNEKERGKSTVREHEESKESLIGFCLGKSFIAGAWWKNRGKGSEVGKARAWEKDPVGVKVRWVERYPQLWEKASYWYKSVVRRARHTAAGGHGVVCMIWKESLCHSRRAATPSVETRCLSARRKAALDHGLCFETTV